MNRKLIIQGGGGHAKVVIDCLLAEGREVVAIFDKKHEGTLLGITRYKEYNPDLFKDAGILVAIGDNKVRQGWAKEISHLFENAIHPSALISEFSQVGVGSMILHGAVVQAGAIIGNHVILNTGSQVDHDSRIGDFVHIAPRAALCGNVTVGEGTLIGAGAVILPGIEIGRWSVIGAGAVVTENVADDCVVAGVPGRLIGRKQN